MILHRIVGFTRVGWVTDESPSLHDAPCDVSIARKEEAALTSDVFFFLCIGDEWLRA